MAWIELHQSLIKHPKTTKAAELMGMDRYKFIGHLVCFWLWALEYADLDGVLPGNVTVNMIALAGGLNDTNLHLTDTNLRKRKINVQISQQQENNFVQALLNCGDENQAGFLEIIDNHFAIHDWREFAGRLMEKRIANKERMYNARATHKANTNNARAGATVPNQPTINTNVLITTSEDGKRLAELLKSLILQNNPIAKVPDDIDKWAKEIDLMINRDKRPQDAIESVIRFSQSNNFWKGNIQSANKLREEIRPVICKNEPQFA